MDNQVEVLLAKWLEKTATKEEIEILSSKYDLDNLERILSMQKQTRISVFEPHKIWDRIDQEISESGDHKLSKFKWLWIPLLLLFGISIYFLTKTNNFEINAQPGQPLEHIFEDGSKVILAPGSTLTASVNDWSNRRHLNLDGQAFFDVSKGPEFIVKTDGFSVTVLGTQFEVNEFGETPKVQCFEGSVNVSTAKDQRILSANKSVLINNFELSDVLTHAFDTSEFLQNRISYEKISIRNLSFEIERFYGKNVKLKGISDKNYFSGVLVLQDQSKALDYIAKAMNWNVEIDNNTIIFSAE